MDQVDKKEKLVRFLEYLGWGNGGLGLITFSQTAQPKDIAEDILQVLGETGNNQNKISVSPVIQLWDAADVNRNKELLISAVSQAITKKYGKSPVEAARAEAVKIFVLKGEIIRKIWNKSVYLMEDALDLAAREGVNKTEMLMCVNEQVEDLYEL